MTRYHLDPDFRSTPKTDCFCCVCSRDLKTVAGEVYLGDGSFDAIDSTEPDFDGFKGQVGPECIKKIPAELRI